MEPYVQRHGHVERCSASHDGQSGCIGRFFGRSVFVNEVGWVYLDTERGKYVLGRGDAIGRHIACGERFWIRVWDLDPEHGQRGDFE